MKIALIGPGIMPIPPIGWGAVEMLIWDYYLELNKQDDTTVDIINPIRKTPMDQMSPYTDYSKELINTINTGNYDFVHIHYDCLYHIMPFLNSAKVAITSHYPYIDNFDKHQSDGYTRVFQSICKNANHYIFALSKKDYDIFYHLCEDKTKLQLILNGSNHNEIQPIENIQEKMFFDKSIYLAKIEPRKRQNAYCNIPDIDFYGKCEDNAFQKHPVYKGEPKRKDLLFLLKNYGNMVLLSDGENGTPLVLKEALMAGLPIVTNKASSDDLDTSLEFIDIIPDDMLDDLVYVQQVIEENRKKHVLKDQIRKYATDHFSWEILVQKYIELIKNI
jgi:glycosyltransferase involved in cell wall biosynthesis